MFCLMGQANGPFEIKDKNYSLVNRNIVSTTKKNVLYKYLLSHYRNKLLAYISNLNNCSKVNNFLRLKIT